MVFILAFSVILLNTNLHNRSVKKKMSCDEYIGQVNVAVRDHGTLPRYFLSQIYSNIRKNELQFPKDAANVELTQGPKPKPAECTAISAFRCAFDLCC